MKKDRLIAIIKLVGTRDQVPIATLRDRREELESGASNKAVGFALGAAGRRKYLKVLKTKDGAVKSAGVTAKGEKFAGLESGRDATASTPAEPTQPPAETTEATPLEEPATQGSVVKRMEQRLVEIRRESAEIEAALGVVKRY